MIVLVIGLLVLALLAVLFRFVRVCIHVLVLLAFAVLAGKYAITDGIDGARNVGITAAAYISIFVVIAPIFNLIMNHKENPMGLAFSRYGMWTGGIFYAVIIIQLLLLRDYYTMVFQSDGFGAFIHAFIYGWGQ